MIDNVGYTPLRKDGAMVTRLIVLGLLSMQPMSGYAIQHYLQLNQTEQWAGILPGSIYHALKRLAAEELVTLHSTEQTGNRTKAIYAITPAGTAELHRLLRQAWGTPGLHFPVALYAAATFLDALPRAEVLSAIERHITALGAELDVWNAGETAKLANLPPQLLEYVRLSFANGREHIEADIRLLHALRELLPTIPRLNVPLPTFDDTPGDDASKKETTS
jgi:DNA-binding PadR family transcriptional regulator